MDTVFSPGLEGTALKIEDHLEGAVEEREELRMPVPERFQVEINWYQSDDVYAVARPENPSVLSFNVVPMFLSEMSDAEQEKAAMIAEYFSASRDFFGFEAEEDIFEILEDPEEKIDRYEEGFSEEAMEVKKELYESEELSYAENTEYFIENAELISGYVDNLSDSMADLTGVNGNLYPVRHELDHAAFFQTDLYQQLNSHEHEEHQISENYVSEEGVELSELVKTKFETLERKSWMDPLMEVRAHFFNFVDEGGWEDADFDEVKSSVRDSVSEYIENSYFDDIANVIVVQAVQKEDLEYDKLREHVNSYKTDIGTDQSRDPDGIQEKPVYRDVVRQIPVVQQKFYDNMNDAVEAVSTAYREDPSRFSDARDAESFEEYLDYLRD